MAGARPLVIAHRGVGARGDRNTLPAIARAVAVGADMVEFDVRRVHDGLVVFHDAYVRGRRISGLTRAELRQRAGVNVPWLVEVLEATQGKIGIMVELKEDGYVREVAELLRRYADPKTTIISSFLDSVVIQTKQIAPEFRTSLMLGSPNPLTSPAGRWSELFPAGRLRRAACDFSGPFWGYARLGAIERAHRVGCPAIAWTINSRRGLRHWLRDPRVYAIITDRAEYALKLRREMAKD